MIPKIVIDMAIGYKSGHNDGFLQQKYKKDLEEIRDYITKILESNKNEQSF